MDKTESTLKAINDYNILLSSLNVSDDEIVQMMNDNVYFDSRSNSDCLEIRNSPIHGQGLFATKNINKNKQWLASFGNCKYPCGRVINHSANPNCKFVFGGDSVFCIAIQKIKAGSELLVNYRDNINLEAIELYKQSRSIVGFTAKVPSVADWSNASPIDKIEYELSTLPAAELPLTHIFTDGLYIRKAFAPAGAMFTTVHHNTEHPFVLLSGTTEVISNDGASSITGPFMGITKKGTRRVVYAVTDAVYMTVHANPDNLSDPDEIINRITIPVENPLMDIEDPRFNTWKKDISPSKTILTNNIN